MKGRFRALPGITITRAAPNAWQVRVPRSAEVSAVLRADPTTLDGGVFSIDGRETEPVVLAAEDEAAVTFSAWVL